MPFSNKIQPTYQPKNLAVKLNNKGEQFVTKKHPWVFSNNIEKISNDPKTGDLAIIFSRKNNKMIGIGLYDACLLYTSPSPRDRG